ncbi:MAG: hypothetical protein AAGA30_05050 [Planctomycetota bacterium]
MPSPFQFGLNSGDDSLPSTTADGVSFLDSVVEFTCPVCVDSDLMVGSLGNTQVCICESCKGFVIDSATMGDMIHHLRGTYQGADDRPVPINAEELDKQIDCPVCFQTMYTHPYYGPGNVVINSCNSCKINWLDEGELAAIVRAPGLRGR